MKYLFILISFGVLFTAGRIYERQRQQTGQDAATDPVAILMPSATPRRATPLPVRATPHWQPSPSRLNEPPKPVGIYNQ